MGPLDNIGIPQVAVVITLQGEGPIEAICIGWPSGMAELNGRLFALERDGTVESWVPGTTPLKTGWWRRKELPA